MADIPPGEGEYEDQISGRKPLMSVKQLGNCLHEPETTFLIVFHEMHVGSVVKNLLANAGEVGSVPGSGRLPGEGNGNPLKYSCLENPMDRGAWQATSHGLAESNTTEQRNNNN